MIITTHIYKYLSRFLFFIVSICIVLLFVRCMRTTDEWNVGKIEEECWRLTRNNIDFERSDSLARILLEYGRQNGDRAVEAKAYYYLGVYDRRSSNVDKRHKNLEKCLSMLEPGRDDTLLLKVYNAMGIYEVAHYRRYSQGIHYFTQSMNLARNLGDEPKVVVAEQNLSAVMIFTGDTIGIKYDEDIFRYAREIGDTALMYRSASHCGIYYSKQRFDEKKARIFAELVKGTSCNVKYHRIMAYIAMHKKDWKDAERHIRAVLNCEPFDATANLNYAELLNNTGRWNLSNRYADLADSLYSLTGSFGPVPETARLRASNNASLGDMPKAYEWERIYSQRQDSLQDLKQRETVTSARIMFDTAKKEHTIELQTAKMRILYTWIFFIFVIAVLALVMMYVFVRKRNRRYKQIVDRSRLAATQERALRDMLNAQDAEINELRRELTEVKTVSAGKPMSKSEKAPKDTPDDVRSERYDQIFGLILREVVDRQGYRDLAITREVLSERVGCNHTYLSETIKRKTGMSYSRYMNSVRVNEAARILSNGTEMSLEELSRYVGFLSVKTFYVAFKEFIGIPPGNFRDIVSEKA